ncbi:hypothetical protein MIND_00295100 [Mycena indigotica]|uniref:Uncharacterized protein n=1 Tax=Mycena indigotica TaxID=2126181 RepID=A0A8H6T1G2_9AGAR|nr:uncharacterized protein MIND_00295100 [Mycena indigotica]KAF7309248.1 hypothetical protein MIND_00295100 [Mycena indigotica]
MEFVQKLLRSKRFRRPSPHDYELLLGTNTPSQSAIGPVGVRGRTEGREIAGWSLRWRGIFVLSLPWLIVVLLLFFPRHSPPIISETSSSPSLPPARPSPSPAEPESDDCPAPPSPPPPRQPPLYELYHAHERLLPQHDLAAPSPDGKSAKYLWFANHGSGFGWGNYMQEMVLNAYLAYAANRAYVFDNYTWHREGPEITTWNGHLIPSRIPLSALIFGPMIGSPMPASSKNIPLSISREWYLQVCPESERVVIDTRKIQDTFTQPPTAMQIVDRWVAELHQIDARCVELRRDSPGLFTYELTNTERVLDVFPSMSASPILANFGWSSLVLGELLANLAHFMPAAFQFSGPGVMLDTQAPIPGLLALHVSRGDYETWCPEAVGNGHVFTGFNRFPELPDKTPSPKDENGVRHCLPSVQDIVDKVRSIVDARRVSELSPLTRVYVMTNAHADWLASLVEALLTIGIWKDGVGTSRELSLSWDGRHVAQAVDMSVGQRAEVFVGNGFSSLTSNIVLLRMHNRKLDPQNTRFW